MEVLSKVSNDSFSQCSFCFECAINCSCVVLRATDCRLCLWAKGWRTYLKCISCSSEWHLHTLDKPCIPSSIPSKWECDQCREAEQERIQSAAILLRLCESSSSASSSMSPVTPESVDYSEPGTPPRKKNRIQTAYYSSSDEEGNNYIDDIKYSPYSEENIICRTKFDSDSSDTTISTDSVDKSCDGFSTESSDSTVSQPPRRYITKKTTLQRTTRSRKRIIQDEENHFTFSPSVCPTKRGSLDVTCRHVVRALRNKSLECSKNSNDVVSFKFQAAQLSDDIGEVRRRVYDVLPVLEGVGIVTRLGRLYVHHGLHRVPSTLRWIASAVDYAKQLLKGPFADEKTDIVRRLAAGRFLKMVIENGPQYNVDGHLVPVTHSTIAEITELARLQTHSNAELKTLGVITLHMLVLLFLEGPVESMTMSELGERIQNDPEYIFMKTSQQQVACAMHNKKSINDTTNRTKSGAGRRLYDVVSVLTGVSLVSTKLISKGNSISKQNGYKSKCVHINPKIFKKAIEQANDEDFIRTCNMSLYSTP